MIDIFKIQSLACGKSKVYFVINWLHVKIYVAEKAEKFLNFHIVIQNLLEFRVNLNQFTIVPGSN